MIRQILIKLGYSVTRPFPEFKDTFIKTFSTAMGDVSIRLDVWDEDLIDLPEAYIHKLPEQLQNSSIPHARRLQGEKGEKYFCYVEKELVNWNPNKPAHVLSWVDKCISKTLDLITDNTENWKNEYQGEFINYWCGKTTHITTISNTASFIEAEVKTGINKSAKEYLIFDTDAVKEKWISSRNAIKVSNSQTTVIVNFPKAYVPNHIDFPPNNLKNLFELVKEVNANSLNQLVLGLLEKINKAVKHQHKNTINIAIVLNTSDGMIGCEVGYRTSIKNAIVSYKRTKKTSKYSPILTSKLHINEFTLLNCKNALEDFVICRNSTSDESLQGKKVALIGAGTIGGYTGQCLVQLGAGSGERGVLDIYDSDTLESHNLGRHFLGASYLRWPKAQALCHELVAQFPHQLTLQPQYKVFSKKDLLRQHYDIVIDATGTQPLSKMLRIWGKEIKQPYLAPIIIHGWIAGFGAAARVLIDNGKVCYSCVNGDGTTPDRFPVFRKGKEPVGLVHSRKCGSVYSAYNSAISLMCAGLIQSAVSCVLTGQKWNFVQQTMDENVQKYPMKTIKPSTVCDCNE